VGLTLGDDIPDREPAQVKRETTRARHTAGKLQRASTYVTPESEVAPTCRLPRQASSRAVARSPAGIIAPLNAHGLFDACHFRDSLPNERGRGAFVGALLGLLDKNQIAPTHLRAARDGTDYHRWSLNRLPGCTEQLLRFINQMLERVIGLKPFSTWRSLARCLGDTRSYLSPKHWACLELKGGGKMASASSPWQSYRTSAGHFDRLADDLSHWLLWCDANRTGRRGDETFSDGNVTPTPTNKAWDPCEKGQVLGIRRESTLGRGRVPESATVEAVRFILQDAWDCAEEEDSSGRKRHGARQAQDNASKRSRSRCDYYI